ncbi:MAG: helix-turn-helix transcriptional regulator [Alphaproteobacteria bacterium]|nr:helix-turn-helix transcriptional regulator [Alphaproteobacteria bacterium]
MQIETIGKKLRELREKQNLFLRQVAASLDMDTALLSKIERDERIPNKDQVIAFARFYKVNADDLLVEWLSDKLVSEVKDEKIALKAVQKAERKLFLKTK